MSPCDTAPHDDLSVVSPLRNSPGFRFLQDDTFITVPVFNMTRTTILGKSFYAPASQSEFTMRSFAVSDWPRGLLEDVILELR